MTISQMILKARELGMPTDYPIYQLGKKRVHKEIIKFFRFQRDCNIQAGLPSEKERTLFEEAIKSITL